MESCAFLLSSPLFFWPSRTMRHGRRLSILSLRRPDLRKQASNRKNRSLLSIRRIRMHDPPSPPTSLSPKKILFIPTGRISHPGSAKVEVKKPIVRPQVTLYGLTIVGHYQSATIVLTRAGLSRKERGRPQRLELGTRSRK